MDANGAGANVGVLQVLVDGAFGTVSGLNVPAADVACRELGAASVQMLWPDWHDAKRILL